MTELKLGKMKGAEIAEWLGIAYNTYKNRIDRQLAKLTGYCEFNKVWGGIEITKIYYPIYKGELKQPFVNDILAEIEQHPISSAAGIARKFKNEQRPAYAEYDDKSLVNVVTSMARVSFGVS